MHRNPQKIQSKIYTTETHKIWIQKVKPILKSINKSKLIADSTSKPIRTHPKSTHHDTRRTWESNNPRPTLDLREPRPTPDLMHPRPVTKPWPTEKTGTTTGLGQVACDGACDSGFDHGGLVMVFISTMGFGFEEERVKEERKGRKRVK